MVWYRDKDQRQVTVTFLFTRLSDYDGSGDFDNDIESGALPSVEMQSKIVLTNRENQRRFRDKILEIGNSLKPYLDRRLGVHEEIDETSLSPEVLRLRSFFFVCALDAATQLGTADINCNVWVNEELLADGEVDAQEDIPANNGGVA